MLHFPSFANENFSLLRIGYDEKRSVKGMKLCVRLLQVNKEHENKKTNLVKFFQEWTGLRNIKDRRGGNTHFHVDRESKKKVGAHIMILATGTMEERVVKKGSLTVFPLTASSFFVKL